MKPAAAEKTLKNSLARIQMTTDLNQLKKCEIVIESVVENMDIKKSLYSQLEKILDKETIMGTNTSSYSITDLVCMHLFKRKNTLQTKTKQPLKCNMIWVDRTPHGVKSLLSRRRKLEVWRELSARLGIL